MGKVLGLNGQHIETEHERLIRATYAMSESIEGGFNDTGLPYGFVLIVFNKHNLKGLGCTCTCSKKDGAEILKAALEGLEIEGLEAKVGK